MDRFPRASQPWLLLTLAAALVGVLALARVTASPPGGVRGAEGRFSEPVAAPWLVPDAPFGVGGTTDLASSAPRTALWGPADNTALALGTDAAAAPRTLSGRIVGPDGDPLSAEVVFAPADPFGVPLELDEAVRMWDEFETVRAKCGGDGRFVLPLPEDFDGDLGVTVLARGYVPLRLERSPLGARYLEDGSLDLGTLRLQRGRVVRGRVSDRSGAPIVGAVVGLGVVATQQGFRVDVPARGVPMATTDGTGEFVLAELAEGPFTLHVEAAGFLTARHAGEAAHNASTPSLVVMEPGVALVGRIIGLEADVRAQHERLRVEARPILTCDEDDEVAQYERDRSQSPRTSAVGSDGSFALVGLLPNRGHTLIVTRASEDGRCIHVREVEQVDVLPRATKAELTWQPLIGAGLLVVDQSSGAPIEEFWLQWGFVGALDHQSDPDDMELDYDLLDASGDYVTRHPGGRAIIERLGRFPLQQHVTLRIDAFGYTSKLLTIDGPSARSRTPDDRIDLGVIALTPMPALVFRLVMAESGEAAPGAEVIVVDERCGDALRWLTRRIQYPGDGVHMRRGRAEMDGRVTIARAPWLCVSVAARAPGLRVQHATRIDLATLGEDEIVLELEASGSVEATARCRDGSPARDVTVVLRATIMHDGETREYWELTTDWHGRASFDDLLVGAYEIALVDQQLEDRGGRYSWTRIAVRAGEVTRHVMSAAPVGTLRGRVLRDGVALSGADVWVEPVIAPRIELERADEYDEGQEDEDKDVYQGDQSGGSSRYGCTASDGAFELGPVSLGSWRLVVVHMDRAMPEVRDIEVREGLNDVDVRISSTELVGRVVDETGEPWRETSLEIGIAEGDRSWSYSEAYVLVEFPDGGLSYESRYGRRYETSADVEGRFCYSGLPAASPLELNIWAGLASGAAVPVHPLIAGEQRDLGDVVVRRMGILVVELATAARVPFELRLHSRADDMELEHERARFDEETDEYSWVLLPGEYRVEAVELMPHVLKRTLDVVVRPDEEKRYQLHAR